MNENTIQNGDIRRSDKDKSFCARSLEFFNCWWNSRDQLYGNLKGNKKIMSCSKRKLNQIVKRIILKDFNFVNLNRKSKIGDMNFYNELLFDCLNMIEFKCELEEELAIQIDFDDDNVDYEKMTVNEFVIRLFDLLHIKGES